MSIANVISSMQTNLSNAYDKINDKGGNLPANKNLENLANAIDGISNYDVQSIDNGDDTQTLVVQERNAIGYTRPTDWLLIPDMPDTEDNIYILNGVFKNGTNMIYFSVSGSGTIDWGDGSTQTFTNETQTTYSHHFNYNNFSSNTWTSYNNSRQALIHISGTRGAITYFSVAGFTYEYTNEDGNSTTYNNTITTDIYQISANVSACEVYCSASAGQHHYKLEIFDWKGHLTNTSVQVMFYYCIGLKYVPQLDISDATNMQSMFSRCYCIEHIPKMDTKNVTNMQSSFYYCYGLSSIPQLDTRNVTNMSQAFSNDYSLQCLPSLNLSSITNVGNTFINCYSLKSLEFYNFNPTSTNSMTLSFSSTMCSNQNVIDLFNSLPSNPLGTRTITLGSTITSNLSNVYVKDSGEYYTTILPTNDTSIVSGKTYYTYNENNDTYTQVTPDFSTNTFYYELVTATWNKWVKCESSDTGATLVLTWATNKGYTIM